MMLIAFSSALLLGIQWFCHKWREHRYALTMSRVMNRVSLLIQKCQSSKIYKYETACIFKTAFSTGEKGLLLPPSQVVMKDDFLVMHEMKSWATIDLSSWVTDGCNVDQQAQPQPFSILLEAVKSDETKSCTDSTNSAHLYSYHILTFGTPVAWRIDNTYALILACDDQCSLVRLVDAFGQQRLVVTDGLEVTSIGTVKTTGYPKAFSRCKTLFSPAKEKEADFPVLSSEESQPVEPKSQQSPDASLQSASPDSASSVTKSASESQGKNLSENGQASSSQSNMNSSAPIVKSNAKPPNVLIYCGAKDTKRKFDEASESIKGCINTDSYTLYHLKHEHILTTPWQDNTAVLIVSGCSRLQPEVEQKISEFVFSHQGNLLNFGSSIDKFFEDRVRVVKNSKSEDMAVFDFREWKTVTSCCGQYLYTHCSKDARVVIQALNQPTEENNAALVISVSLDEGRNNVILSQLFLEQDPVFQAKSKEVFDALKKSNTSRLAVLLELLGLVGLDTCHATPPALTFCYLMAQREGLKEHFLGSFKSRLQDGVLKSKAMSLRFLSGSPAGDRASLIQPRPDFLPVLTHTNVGDVTFEFFDAPEYWMHLKTSSLGQIVLYTDVISSTMPVFDGCLFSIPQDMAPVAIAGRQVQGKGRGGNTWLSPCGCAMFTLPLRLDLHSPLGQRVSFLQHLVSLAVVRGVLTLPGYQHLDLRLKWPNDIYYGREMKLGGVLVQSTVMGKNVYGTIGCGVNVANSDPTICINDIIQLQNASSPDLSPLQPLTTGQVIACTLTCLEELIRDYNSKGHDYVSNIYCQHWMHSGSKVKVDLDTKCEGEIVGVDDYGFLSIRTEGGKLISVQPDGNSFDMMHNLIHFKAK